MKYRETPSSRAVRLLNVIRNDALARRLARGTLTAIAINLLAILMAFSAELVLTHVLGATTYGIYAFVFAWVNILTLVATLGFQQGLLRFVGTYRALGEDGLVRAVAKFAERYVSSIGIVIALTGALVIFVFRGQIQKHMADTFLIGLAVVPVLSLLRIRASVTQACGGVASAMLPDMVVRETTVFFLVGGAALLTSMTLTAPLAMAAMLTGTCFGFLLVSLSPHYRGAVTGVVEHGGRNRSKWIRTALLLAAISGTQLALRQVEIISLGWLTDTTVSGFYAVTLRIANLLSLPLLAANVVFLPTIAAIHARNDHAELQRQVSNWILWTTVGAIVIALPLFLFAETVLSLFGEPFRAASVALRILLVGQLINGSLGSVGFILIMTGNERLAAIIVGVVAPISLISQLVLISYFGIEGAASARTATLIGLNIIYAAFVWKYLKIRPVPIWGMKRNI